MPFSIALPQTTSRRCSGPEKCLESRAPTCPRARYGRLTAEPEVSQPANEVGLSRNQLRLPENDPKHQAHHHGAHRKSETHLRFTCRNAKTPNQPGHDLVLLVLTHARVTAERPQSLGAIEVPKGLTLPMGKQRKQGVLVAFAASIVNSDGRWGRKSGRLLSFLRGGAKAIPISWRGPGVRLLFSPSFCRYADTRV
jgi:hypothetical protein